MSRESVSKTCPKGGAEISSSCSGQGAHVLTSLLSSENHSATQRSTGYPWAAWWNICRRVSSER